MGGGDTAGMAGQRIVLTAGLLSEDIYAGGVELAGVERVDHCLLVQHCAAAGVKEDGAVLHFGNGSGVDHAPGAVV